MLPELNRLAEMYMGDQKKRDDIIIAKADGSTYYSISSRYGISSYPTIVLFKKGQVFPERYHEARNADSFSEFIERVAGPEEKSFSKEEFTPPSTKNIISKEEFTPPSTKNIISKEELIPSEENTQDGNSELSFLFRVAIWLLELLKN